MLTSEQAFKVGFLRRCADAGLSEQETVAVVKQATEFIKSGGFVDTVLTTPYTAGVDVVSNTLKGLGNLGVGALLLGPVAAGGAIGYGLSKATDVDKLDVDEVKNQELIDEYKRQIALMRAARRGVYKRPGA